LIDFFSQNVSTIASCTAKREGCPELELGNKAQPTSLYRLRWRSAWQEYRPPMGAAPGNLRRRLPKRPFQLGYSWISSARFTKGSRPCRKT
jgi:hypothetical protein